MKIKILDEIPFVEGYVAGSIYENAKEIKFTIKNSKGFIIIRNNIVEYLEKHKFPYSHLQQDNNPLIITPFVNFNIRKLTKDTFNGHKYSSYQIKININGLKDHWYFVDLNPWRFFRLQFNANTTWINKSNIYRFIYLIIGAILGVLGTIISQYLTTT